MRGRRVAVTMTTLAVTVFGGGVALAATHGRSQSQPGHATSRAQVRPFRGVATHMSKHVCRPGQKGSMIDSLQ
jgi:hypothetical protein